MMIVTLLLAVVVAVLTVLVLGLLRSHAEMIRILHDLGLSQALDPSVANPGRPSFDTINGVPGPRPLSGSVAGTSAAIDIVGVTPAADAVSLGIGGTSHPTLLAFLSSGCTTCADFWQAFANGESTRLPGGATRLVVVTKGPEHESPGAVASVASPELTTVMSSQAWLDYGVPASPYFILVDGPSSSIVGEGAAATWTQVVALLRDAVDDGNVLATGSTTPAATGPIDLRDSALDTPAPGTATGDRLVNADAALAAAGIEPGDPSLWSDPFADSRPVAPFVDVPLSDTDLDPDGDLS